MFSIPHLEALVAISELGSFRAASERLNVTQPSVSLRIKELEQSLGLQLFDRSGYRPRLTADGQEVLKLAQRILELTRDIRAVARGKAALRGKLRLGAADTFALSCLPALLTQLEARAPALQVALDIDYSVNLDKKIHDSTLDIAFLTSPTQGSDVALERLVPIELVWVASARFGFDNAKLKPRDLAAVPIITNPEPSNLYTTVQEWFGEADIKPARISTCSSLLHIARLSEAGVGVALLPLAILRDEIASGVLSVLNTVPGVEPHWLYMAVRTRPLEPASVITQEIARKIVGSSALGPLQP